MFAKKDGKNSAEAKIIRPKYIETEKKMSRIDLLICTRHF
jgi:hypothetical protein